MANDKIVEVPGLGTVSFPGDMSDDAIAFQIKTQGTVPDANQQARQTITNLGKNMQGSQLPSMVRNAGYALPAIGTTIGGMVAAPGLVTTPAGGAAGAFVGDQARQLAMNRIFGDTDPASKKGLESSGIAAAAGGIGETPNAIAQSIGQRAMSKMAAREAQSLSNEAFAASANAESKANVIASQRATAYQTLRNAPKVANQYGDVSAAIDRVMPTNVSKQGLKTAFQADNARLSTQLNYVLSRMNNPTTVDVDLIVSPLRSEAALADISQPGVAKNFEDVVTAAKNASGIRTTNATPQQIANFKNFLQQYSYRDAADTNMGKVVAPIVRKAAQTTNNSLRVLVPDAAPILDKMTDNHAAMAALKYYVKPPLAPIVKETAPRSAEAATDILSRLASRATGIPKSVGIAAAKNPAAAAAISPLATAAGGVGAATGVVGPTEVRRYGKELIP